MRYAVITGAGSGIGQAVAEALSETHQVALIGRRRETLTETAARCRGTPLLLEADITVAGAVAAAFAEVDAAWGRIDLLFNNAGTNVPSRRIDEQSAEDIFGVIASNLLGSLYCAREAFALMRRQKPQGGRIINNGSVSAYAPRPGSPAYTAAKHGVTGLTKSLILDGAPFGITCCQIDIGNAATPRTQRMAAGVPQADGTTRPEPRMPLAAVVRHILHIAEMPDDGYLPFSTILPRGMPLYGRG